jgi:hypothetical protein
VNFFSQVDGCSDEIQVRLANQFVSRPYHVCKKEEGKIIPT